MEQSTRKKIFHICMIIIIIVAIFFAVGVIMLRYEVEGETNLPFQISKIRIISSVDATDNADEVNRWNLSVDQNNDVYIYIEKNDNYQKQEIIKSIVLNNFVISKESNLGTINIFKPAVEENIIFKNIDENKVEQLEFTGDLENNMKELKISNQGGMIAFRCGNTGVAKYVSNDQTEVNYMNLLNLTKTTNEVLKTKITFDVIINLNSKKSFKATISLDMPAENIVENGTSSIELTDMSSIIFKRIENN